MTRQKMSTSVQVKETYIGAAAWQLCMTPSVTHPTGGRFGRVGLSSEGQGAVVLTDPSSVRTLIYCDKRIRLPLASSFVAAWFGRSKAQLTRIQSSSITPDPAGEPGRLE